MTLPQTDNASNSVDHLAIAESRRIEMIVEWDGKIRAAEDQTTALMNEARAKRREASHLQQPTTQGGGGNHDGGVILEMEAKALEDQAVTLKAKIPPLKLERDSIRAGTQPEISLVQLRALRAVERDRVAAIEKLWADADKAQRDFDQHIRALARPETIALARILEAAAKAVKRTPDRIVLTLLTLAKVAT